MNIFNKILDTILIECDNITKKGLLSKLFDKYTQTIINDKYYQTEFEYTLGGNYEQKKVIILYLEAWKRTDRSDKPKVIYLNEEQKMYMSRVLSTMMFEDSGKLFEAETLKIDFTKEEREIVLSYIKK